MCVSTTITVEAHLHVAFVYASLLIKSYR